MSWLLKPRKDQRRRKVRARNPPGKGMRSDVTIPITLGVGRANLFEEAPFRSIEELVRKGKKDID